ncbi:MAG: hypothetical protein DCC66_08065 [Planctomycetota bacterium]|nr:MAG: hypothetical protein DCC66_08065 [Planctomycetota bacterium]
MPFARIGGDELARPWCRAAGERTCEEACRRINVCLLARHPETKAGLGFSPKASAFESVARGLGTGSAARIDRRLTPSVLFFPFVL